MERFDDNTGHDEEEQEEEYEMQEESAGGATRPLPGDDQLLNLGHTDVETETSFIDSAPPPVGSAQDDMSFMDSNDGRTVRITTRNGNTVDVPSVESPDALDTRFGDVDESTFNLSFKQQD